MNDPQPEGHMASHIGRRKFLALLGGAAVAWPLTARAQQPAMPVIGYLHSGSSSSYAHLVAAFRGGLKETGYVEGRNVAIDFRWAEGRYNQLPALAADLVSRHVAVIVAQGGDPPPLAAKSATSTIPIVFTISSDPVQLGLVDSLNRPGGNATGFWAFTSLLGTKRLELMQQLLPANTLIGVLVNPNNPNAHIDTTQLQDAARTLGQSIILVRASTEAEIDAVFAALSDQRVSALLVNTDPFFLARRERRRGSAGISPGPQRHRHRPRLAQGLGYPARRNRALPGYRPAMTAVPACKGAIVR